MTLVLHLHGPMQSWGGAARFDTRNTFSSPTKSGVTGFLAAASGRKRGADISDIAQLTMTVRVDNPGSLMRDFHTVGANHPKGRRLIRAESGAERKDPIVSERYYLADATFTLALEGETETLEALESALQEPIWPLALGRRSCPPAEPYLLGSDPRESLLLLEKIIPVFRPKRPFQEFNSVVQIIKEDPDGDVMPFADQPTTVLNRWSTYQYRKTKTLIKDFSENMFVNDHFEVLKSLRATQNGEG